MEEKIEILFFIDRLEHIHLHITRLVYKMSTRTRTFSSEQEKDRFYRKLSIMNFWDYMEEMEYFDYSEIPKSDYKYLGLNSTIVQKLLEWDTQMGEWQHDPEDKKEPKCPLFLPRVLYHSQNPEMENELLRNEIIHLLQTKTYDVKVLENVLETIQSNTTH